MTSDLSTGLECPHGVDVKDAVCAACLADPMTASGGARAPFSYDLFTLRDPGDPDPEALVVALDAAKAWINGTGSFWPISVPDGTKVLTAANTIEEARVVLADQLARMAITAYTKELARSPVEFALPKISAPRGGISYLRPPNGPPPTGLTLARLKARRAAEKVRAPLRRARAARGRLRDARAVWRGTKTAFTDTEIEDMTDDY